MTVVDILVRYWPAFLSGLRVTLELAGITWAVGLGIGTLLGVAAHRSSFWSYLTRGVSFLLAGIPFLVLLYWAHYPAQVLLDIVVNPFVTAVTILCILNVFGVAEICRGALDSFPREYILAAKVCGLSSKDTVLKIQLPMVLRQAIPGMLSLQVVMLQMTLFASLISVEELFRVAQRINSAIHKPVEIYTALAFFFLMVCLPLNGLAVWLRSKFTRDFSDR